MATLVIFDHTSPIARRAARSRACERRLGRLLPDHEAIANLPAGIGFAVLRSAASFVRRSFSALWAVRTATDFRLNLISLVCPSQTIQPFSKWMIVYIALIPKICAIIWLTQESYSPRKLRNQRQ